MRTARGFTLVELVIVIAITGVLAASVTIFLKPAIDSYFDTRRRAEMTDMADTALRRMSFDIRRAVPNSVISNSATCFSLVPTIAGGRYRMAPDTLTAGTTSASLVIGATIFDVLSIEAQRTLDDGSGGATPDMVVVENTSSAEILAGTNRANITAIATPALATDGVSRLTLASSPVLQATNDAGRFVVVPGDEPVVTYSCAGGTLFRNVTAFGAAIACGVGVPVATADAVGCVFTWNSAIGTSQNGLVWMNLTLTRNGEVVTLSHSTNVPNVP